ncbi:MAG: glycosyltransferase family 2 protein [Enhydrobacter sp.]|nr:glycosyltransferase family 2 protein [Enhydrobacter sp.]
MRIALVDTTRPDDVYSRNRFSNIARLLTAHGHEAILVDGAIRRARDIPPILTGLNRAIAAAPMIEANALAHSLAERRPEVIIAPLRGGIAQGILMARACSEAFARTRVVLWCDTPSATLFLRDDGLSTGLGPLIADALERQSLMLADALIMPPDVNLDILSPLGNRVLPSFHAALRPAQEEGIKSRPPRREIKEIVFAGKMTRRAGLLEFIEAMMRLAKIGLMAGRTATFLGPVVDSAQGLGREWLGLRATNWSFPFKVLDLLDHEERQRYLEDPHRLAVAIADDPDELVAFEEPHVAILRRSGGEAYLLAQIENALAIALGYKPNTEPPQRPAPVCLDWPTLVGKIVQLPCTGDSSPLSLERGATVCILHHNRLEYLADAIKSIPDEVDGQPIEILVLDNASDIESVAEEIRRIAGPRKSLRIVCFETSIPQAEALNRGIREAQFETVVILDDDNYFSPGGVHRLVRALANSRLDIVVTALDVFDDGVPEAPSAGRLIFLGAAHSAGLFFNAFGDTAMAVRRDSFRRIGGFQEFGYRYPSLDWVALARAQAMGLRIGALQWPAVRYRRNTGRTDVSGIKIDLEGARSLVFEAYGTNLNAALLARYAQKLHLEEM